MGLFWVTYGLAISCLALQGAGLTMGGKPNQIIKPYKRAPLQDIVTWDAHSIFVRGQRILLYSGEFHPFRLPVPSLWLDVFQKIKALGFSGVSFYVDWALLEGKQGNFTAEGIFALEPFFAAASEAGIYLVARPGPYINAEVSGGGFPGWLQRYKAVLRTPDYLPETENYVRNIGPIIAKAQITNGGPIILVQPENEYTFATAGTLFPNAAYFQAVEDQLRATGIVVPFISNDAAPLGLFAPGKGTGEVQIYGHDSYPLGFDCANPYLWPAGALPTYYHTLHLMQSPGTPYTISEMQGGSFDPWGGSSFTKCAILLNEQFERVFYKNDYSVAIAILNIYMIYGGTNWGNLGHPGGYTSYDYGAAITEERLVTREKYSELKLEANFLRASGSAYLTSTPGNVSNGSYVDNDALATTPLFGNKTNFYVVRHAEYNSQASTNYKLTVSTSAGTISIPQLSPTLTLNGRDSKIHVTDYDVGGINMLYASAEIFTWSVTSPGFQDQGLTLERKMFMSRTVLVLYGGLNETHEVAFSGCNQYEVIEGAGINVQAQNGELLVNWAVTPDRKVIQVDENLFVYLLERNDAYNYWVLDLAGQSPVNNYTVPTASSVIVKAGYLLRTAAVNASALYLTGDINATTSIEIIGGAPNGCSETFFNGEKVQSAHDKYGVVTGSITYTYPNFKLPSLTDLDWKYIDSLPEIQSNYDDAAWTSADVKISNNTVQDQTTPTSLFASDYGYNTGNLLYRGHFIAAGEEATLYLKTQGGTAYGASVWLNSTFLGSWAGIDRESNYSQTLALPNLKPGEPAVLTVLIDNMGLDEDFRVGSDQMKNPRGILQYALSSRKQAAITWQLTGDLGGENYRDHTRGPLNEGGLYAERQGFHLPAPPSEHWASGKPTDGISRAGVGFYTTSFRLDMPIGYDIPLSFDFTNATVNGTAVSNYRAQLYVNGYQFGKYVHNIGPQTSFPVPEGILNYHGVNYLALSLWALDARGAKIENLRLVSHAVIQSGYGTVELSPMPTYSPRPGAY